MEMKAFLTDAGSAVVTQLLASQGELTVTRAEIGSGIVTSEEAARERTELISKLADANLTSCTLSNQQAAIDVQYSNEDQEESYSVGEIGIYCKDPSDETQEVLYCYATFGDTPDTIVAGSTALYTRTYRVFMFVSDVQNVTAEISPAGTVSPSDLDAAISALETEIAAELEEKADKTLLTAAVGTPGVDPMKPVFTGSDGKLGVLTAAEARTALGVPRIWAASATLTAAGWNDAEPSTQTVTVEGMTADAHVIVSGDPEEAEAYAAWLDAGAYCSAQGEGTLTFTASMKPETELSVNLLVVEVIS